MPPNGYPASYYFKLNYINIQKPELPLGKELEQKVFIFKKTFITK